MHPYLPPAVREAEQNGKRVFYIGPYRLAERLGKGGMGAVYRAQHIETGELVAIKTASTTEQIAVVSIRREAEILEQLDHPGVVRLVDKGTSRGVPWLAMELIEGSTLLSLLRQHETAFDSHLELSAPGTTTNVSAQAHLSADGARGNLAGKAKRRAMGADVRRRFDLEKVRPVFVVLHELCQTLSYLHNQGVVHRDLKPPNISLRAGNEPVLVDFGVVSWFEGTGSRERLVGIDRRRFAGTLQYMAPEQIRGDLVDARADLYAVGCMLYLAVTGRHPFRASTPQELMRRHFDGDYVPAEQLVAEIPAALSSLIGGLLQPSAQQRVSHADVVADTLAELCGAASVSAGESGEVRSTHLSKPRFVGRHALIEDLADALDEAPTPNLLFIGGLSGSGKTRTAIELAAAAERAGFRVTAESADVGLSDGREPPHAEPLAAFRATLQAVADHCRERGVAETERVVGRRATVLAQYEPSLARLPGDHRFEQPVELPSRAARVRAFAYLTETLDAFASEQPLLVIIDDLHLADELTLAFLESSLHTGGLENVTVAATYTVGEAGTLTELLAHEQVREFELEPLGRQDIASMVESMLAIDQAPEPLVDRLVAESAGNPFAVSEYVRAAVEQGELFRTDDGGWSIDPGRLERAETAGARPLSGRLSQLIEGRLERLSVSDQRLVDCAAVVARRLDRALLAEAAAMEEAELDAAVARLCQRGLLEENEGRLRLVGKVRQVAYARLTAQRRRQLHHRVARILERRGTDIDVTQLLEQWRGAGVRSRELCFIEPAANDALVRGASGAARRLLRRGLRLVNQLDDDSYLRRARLERLLARVHWSQGKVDQTITMLEYSLAHLGVELPETNTDWTVRMLEEGALQLKNMVWPPAQIQQGEPEYPRVREQLESGLALFWAFVVQGEFSKAATLGLMLANLADRLHERDGYAVPYAVMGAACRRFGLERLAKTYEMQAWANFNERSASDFVSATQIFAYSCASRGEWAEADRLLRRGLEMSERAGDQLSLDSLLVSSAVLEVTRDCLERATRLVGRLEDSPIRGESERGDGWIRIIRAMIARRRGDSANALELLEGQETRFAAASDHIGRCYVLAIRAACASETGQTHRAFSEGRKALDVFQASTGGAEAFLLQYHIYQCLAEALLNCWRDEELDSYQRQRALSYARHIVSRLRAFVRRVPAAMPTLLRNQGVLAAIGGDVAGGSALLSKSVQQARQFHLPYEDRLARRAAAALAALPRLE